MMFRVHMFITNTQGSRHVGKYLLVFKMEGHNSTSLECHLFNFSFVLVGSDLIIVNLIIVNEKVVSLNHCEHNNHMVIESLPIYSTLN